MTSSAMIQIANTSNGSDVYIASVLFQKSPAIGKWQIEIAHKKRFSTTKSVQRVRSTPAREQEEEFRKQKRERFPAGRQNHTTMHIFERGWDLERDTPNYW
jgi:hypothetical protein